MEENKLIANVPSCKRWTGEGYKHKIMNKLNKIERICRTYHKWTDAESAMLEILCLVSENTESVSDDPTESGVLHGVSESLANDRTDAVSQSSVDGALEKITEDENESCPKCGSSYLYMPNSVVCCNTQCSFILRAN